MEEANGRRALQRDKRKKRQAVTRIRGSRFGGQKVFCFYHWRPFALVGYLEGTGGLLESFDGLTRVFFL